MQLQFSTNYPVCLVCHALLGDIPLWRIRSGRGKYCSKRCKGIASRKSTEQYFWGKVEKTPLCWIWTGKRSTYGYGLITHEWDGGRQHYFAHRVSWELHNGQIPDGTFVSHHCNNSICVRPDHLLLATAFDIHTVPPAAPLSERFWSYVDQSDNCWLWTGPRDRNGYGRISERTPRRSLLTHRVSWELHFGPIPDGLFVCHHCDNPPCVRPTHLFLGTQRDNMGDAAKKGRLQRKLSVADVRQIRTDFEAGETKKGLGRKFGVHATDIALILTGKIFAWVS